MPGFELADCEDVIYILKAGTDHVVAEFKVTPEGERDDLEQHPRTLRRWQRGLRLALLIAGAALAFTALALNFRTF
jgi:hypothetical protein